MSVKGIQGATVARIELAAKARALRDEGYLQREIAERLGISRSYANALLTDPDGSQARARKDGYAGECVDCGAPTTGSDGPGSTPKRCQECSYEHAHASRRWSQAAIIDAIRRFAARHGRPPLSEEWIRADLRNGYPPRTAVYSRRRVTNRYDPPFRSWADAIEAAGFPRPMVGQKYLILRAVTCPDCGLEEEKEATRNVQVCDDCRRRRAREAYAEKMRRRRRTRRRRVAA